MNDGRMSDPLHKQLDEVDIAASADSAIGLCPTFSCDVSLVFCVTIVRSLTLVPLHGQTG
jgi:hypothetical protein